MSVIKKRTRNIKTANQPRSKNAVVKKMANRPCDEKRVKKTTSQPRNQKGVKNSRKRTCPPPYDKNKIYQPERIVRKCRLRGKLYYAVKWVGYDENSNTWEPAWNMASFEDMIADFELREKEARKSSRKKRARLRYQENEQPLSKRPKQLLSPSATKNGPRSNRDVDPLEYDGLHQYQMHVVSESDGEFESSKRELFESLELMRVEESQTPARRELDHFDTTKNVQRSRNPQPESYWSPSPIENRIHRAWSNRKQNLSKSLFHTRDDSLYKHEVYLKESRETRKAPRKRSSSGYQRNGERLWDTLQSVFSPSAIQNDTGLEREEDLSDCSLDENDNRLFQYVNDSRRSWTPRRNVKGRRCFQSDQTMSELEVLEEEVERIVGGTVVADGEMYFIIKLKNQQMHVLRNDQARRCISRHLIKFYERNTEWLTDNDILQKCS